jgi:hypothetical protein
MLSSPIAEMHTRLIVAALTSNAISESQPLHEHFESPHESPAFKFRLLDEKITIGVVKVSFFVAGDVENRIFRICSAPVRS